MTAEERFWSRVHKTATCWLWTGAPSHIGGYGHYWYRKRCEQTHRVAWALSHGGDFPDECVLHHCDVRLCVRPSHLFLGDRADNIRDMCNKGRQRGARGSRNRNAKLTRREVEEIRALAPYMGRRRDQVTQVTVARYYGVSREHIRCILRGRVWANDPR